MIKPFYLDLTESEIEDIKEKLGEILRNGTLILGKYTEEFEREFADYVGTKYAVALNTCTSALEVLLTIKGAKGKKIAVPTNTNFATVEAIIKSGGIPVYMDMTSEYFVPSLDILKYTFNKYKDIRGVAWVHIGGVIPPDFFEIVEYCRRRSVFLIEDCAHAHGSQYKGIKAGNFADGGAFSFFPTKVMTTMEGGMITTNSEEVALSLRDIKKRNYLYRIEKIDRNVCFVLPGKFSLGFSLAVNTFRDLVGHYPNTYVIYDKNLDVREYIGLMRHRSIILNNIPS